MKNTIKKNIQLRSHFLYNRVPKLCNEGLNFTKIIIN